MESKQEQDSELAQAEEVEDEWSDWKRMLEGLKWKFHNDVIPETCESAHSDLRKMLEVMKKKEVPSSKIRHQKDLKDCLEDIGCYVHYKQYIEDHLKDKAEELNEPACTQDTPLIDNVDDGKEVEQKVNTIGSSGAYMTLNDGADDEGQKTRSCCTIL